jgi:error-prone DNA polymerase
LEGASHPDELVTQAAELGLPALALTDRDGVYGIVRAHVAALAQNKQTQPRATRLLYGAEVSVCAILPEGERLDPATASAATVATPVLLAQNRAGYGRLCTLLSLGRRRCDKGAALVTLDELAGHADDLLLLWHNAPAVANAVATQRKWLQPLQEAFGDRAYSLITRHRQAKERSREQRLRLLASGLQWPAVAGSEVLYHNRDRRALQDVLTCTRHGVTLHTAGQLLRPNDGHRLLTPAEFAALYADCPELVARTLEVAGRCDFDLGALRYRYPVDELPNGLSVQDWLRQLTQQGALWRWPGGVPPAAQAQIDKELRLIGQLDYGGYFLTMYDIVQFCQRANILCQGRGSAANSIVCYCLGITAIDPVQMNLLFERFLSLERAEPPDIDLDIEHQRREEVIQYVYGRFDSRHPAAGRQTETPSESTAETKSGSHAAESMRGSHAAMVANFIRYRSRSAVRDVGKALALHETEIDRLSRQLSPYGSELTETNLQEAALHLGSTAHQQLLTLTNALCGFPRHLSIHPGGFLLGHDPVDTLVPIENATMQDRTVIQWDKEDIESLGLFKVDLLGLGMLSQIHGCFDLIAQHEGQTLTMATVPHEDPAVYAMISAADTVGLFQIESRAQMSMLPRLQPRTFYDLVIEVAIIRPGPISGGMVHPFLRRREGKETVVYPHPDLKPILHKTLGVPLFQEQVMRLAMVAADYTPGEADQLRRDMGAWRSKGKMDHHRHRLIERMTAKGIDPEFAQRIYQQLEGFGEYGFPESHAASFALIAYVTAWLKYWHPAAFVCALLNAQPMGFYSPATLIDDAKRHGIHFLPVSVQDSQWSCLLVRGNARPPDTAGPLQVRMGLQYVRGLQQADCSRWPGPPYASLEDFVARARPDRRTLDALAEAGALDCFGLSRREALWQARALHARVRQQLQLPQWEDLPLFAGLSAADVVRWDYAAGDHSVRGHPVAAVRDVLRRQGLPTAADIGQMRGGREVRYVGAVICRQRPMTAKGVVFFTLEDETGLVNLVVWAAVYEAHRLLAKHAQLLGVTGELQVSSGVRNILAKSLWAPDTGEVQETVTVAARNFH